MLDIVTGDGLSQRGHLRRQLEGRRGESIVSGRVDEGDDGRARGEGGNCEKGCGLAVGQNGRGPRAEGSVGSPRERDCHGYHL